MEKSQGGGSMRFTREGNIMKVDLHGMYVEDARSLLRTWLSNAPDSIEELRVIHGYRQGDALQTMLRQDFQHARVSDRLPALNPGETRLILKRGRKKKA